ncbi:hypothetical protein Ddc_16724 [Ditylenchus destructor]|nr:hypothetical protein Ddc_16724 [Ditylenchus destructor]
MRLNTAIEEILFLFLLHLAIHISHCLEEVEISPGAVTDPEGIKQIPLNRKRFHGEPCRKHCRRLLERSLERIGYSSHKVAREYSVSRLLLDKDKEIKDNFKDICWKYFDFADCVRNCDASPLSTNPRVRRRRRQQIDDRSFQRSTRLLIKRCRQNTDKEVLTNFQCIHKFHTFIEVQCSSYANEAVQLRILARKDKRARARRAEAGASGALQEAATRPAKAEDKYQVGIFTWRSRVSENDLRLP